MARPCLLLLLLLCCALPAQAQIATNVTLFRINNGGLTPIAPFLAPANSDVFFRFDIKDANGADVFGDGTISVLRDGAVLASGIAWNAGTTRTFKQNLGSGEHSYVLQFVSTNPAYSSSASPTLYQTWGSPAGPETATVLSSLLNPSQFADLVGFTAQVLSMAGSPPVVGTVQLVVDGTAIGTTPVDVSGQATFSSTQPVGNHTCVAIFTPGDVNHVGSTSDTLIEVVNPRSTTVAVSSSANPSLAGTTVTLTATVTAGPLGNPPGSVDFVVDGTTTTVAMTPGTNRATFTTAPLAIGNHPVSVTYSGSANTLSSTNTLTGGQQAQAAPTTALVSSVDPSVFGQPVNLTATVTGAGPTPSGTVQFSFNGGNLGPPQSLDASGKAVLSVPGANLTVGGPYPVSFTYSGDNNYTTGAAGTLSGGQVVSPASTSTAVTSSSNPVPVGQAVSFQATVNAQAPGGGTPTGFVTFVVDGISQAPLPLAAGTASLSLPTGFSTLGPHTVSASYGATSNYLASSGTLVQNANPPPFANPDALYRVGLQLISGPTTVAAGGVAQFRVAVQNQGTRDDRYSLSASGYASLSAQELTVGAGGSAEVMVTVAVPSNANPDTLRLSFTALSEHSPDQSATLYLATQIAGTGTFSMTLRPGWNGLGFACGQVATLVPDHPVPGMARFLNGGYELVPFSPSAASPTTQAFWVYAQDFTTVTYTGSLISDGSINLQTGWNLVSFPCDGVAQLLSNPDVGTQLAEIQPDGTYLMVQGSVTPGRAYWVFARAATTLRYSALGKTT